MKLLITGASGFLGKYLVQAACRQDVTDIRLLVRRRDENPALRAIQDANPNVNIDVRSCNLLSRDEILEAVQGVDIVIHAAAGTRGAAADMYANSVIGTRNLLEACNKAGVRRLALISSFSVYNTSDLPDWSTVSESTPVEVLGVDKGVYAYTKVQQENLFRSMQKDHGFEFVVLRPGVIYGPGSDGISSRVGIGALGVFLKLGRSNPLPLTYVENCADAIVLAALSAPSGGTYNIVDDDHPNCSEFLNLYQRRVEKLRVIPMSYSMTKLFVRGLTAYSRKSKGQLPAILTDYIVRSMYRPFKYTNQALKDIHWTQKISTEEGLRRTLVPKATR